MPQTSVPTTMTIGVAGQLADLWTEQFGDVASATSEEASAEIPFGVAVRQGTADDGVLKLSATNQVIAGIVVHSHLYDKPTDLGDTGLKSKTTFDILRKGRILVTSEEDVAPGNDVRVRCVVAGNEVAGAFRKTADSTDCIDITPFAQWRSTATAGELAVLEVDFTNIGLAVADT